MEYDVIIIGGSYAGMSAALPLARARRSVLVVDGGLRRNRFAAASHGFLTQDGASPDDIAADARSQLMEYPSVHWLGSQVEQVSGRRDAFTVRTAFGEVHRGRRLILATGVSDELPALPGLSERWGRQVFHCPYCHGYELQRGRIGVLALSEVSLHQALMLPDWGRTTLFLNDCFEPDAQQLQALQARCVAIERGAVQRLEGEGLAVVMADGRRTELDGLFIAAPTRVGGLPQQLGCVLEDGPVGRYVKTDEVRATSVEGVFACGDMARAAGSVPLAVGDGAMAGVGAHRSLMFG